MWQVLLRGDTLLHLLLFHNTQNMKRFTSTLSCGQVNASSVDLKSPWFPQHLFPVCQWGKRCLWCCRFFSICAFIKYLGDVTKIFISNCKGRCLLLVDSLFLRPCETNNSNAKRCRLGGCIPHPYLCQRLSYPQTIQAWSQGHTNST